MTVSAAPAQRVFITGASSGLGAALAREYAAQGAQLGLLARRADRLAALVATLPNAGLHHCYAVDVNDHAALAAAANDFLGQAGGIDIVIANAGVSYGTLTERGADLPQLQKNLKCGTFCGSCVPDIKRMVAEHPPKIAAAA